MTVSCGNTFPTIGNYYPDSSPSFSKNSILNCASMAKGHVTNANVVQMLPTQWSSGTTTWFNWSAILGSIQEKGYANNIRTEYQSKFI